MTGAPDGRTRLLGILGRPLEHSLSPELHTAVLRSLDRNLIYVPFPVSESRLPEFLDLAPEIGVLGVNVTTPYKEIAARLTAAADLETQRTGMVNTIRFRSEGPEGSGTDGAGILHWMASIGLAGAPFGVLGFGPTARSLAHRALALGSPLAAVVTRRPEEVAASLRAWADSATPAPAVVGWDGPFPKLPLWISALPPDAGGSMDRFWSELPRDTALVDLNYGAGRARLAEEARARGIAAADGFGPLLHQAALSLSVWLGEPIEAEVFFRASGRSDRSLRLTR